MTNDYRTSTSRKVTLTGSEIMNKTAFDTHTVYANVVLRYISKCIIFVDVGNVVKLCIIPFRIRHYNTWAHTVPSTYNKSFNN